MSDSTSVEHRIRGVRMLLEIARREVADLEALLTVLLAEAGRRGGPEDQQLRLFDPARQPKLFG